MKRPEGDGEGLNVRLLAARLLASILVERRTIGDVLENDRDVEKLSGRDRGFLLILLMTTFRHRGEIEAVLNPFIPKPLPRKSGLAPHILSLATAQLLFLDTPPHAAINLAVSSAKADRNATHFSGLVNAVLRRVSVAGRSHLKSLDAVRLNTPDWLWNRWTRNYGADNVRLIANAHAEEPPLDIATKSDTGLWAESLGGTLLPTGHIRLPVDHEPVPELPGYSGGGWWIQDAAAGIPAMLFGDLEGKSALDLCAAPGGKTLQMCAAGAHVTSVDSSASRLRRMRENLARTGLQAELVEADVLELDIAESFDAVLLDAPCSATGTIRRHPELPYLKSEAQVGNLVALQRRLLMAASARVGQRGKLVYSTCSLEPEEGEDIIKWFLAKHAEFELVPAQASGLPQYFVAPDGWVRTLPFMKIGDMQGLDGFFAVLLQRR